MVHKFSITGVDGAGKSSTLYDSVQILSDDYKIGKTGRGPYVIENREVTRVLPRLGDTIEDVLKFMDKTKNRMLIGLANTAFVLLQKFIEQHTITNYNPDFVFNSRDMIVDSAVYSSFYFPLVSERMNLEQKIRLIEIFSGASYRDMIIFLTAKPGVAVQRIEKRIMEAIEREALEDQDLFRLRWRHLHEEEEMIRMLLDRFYKVLNIIYQNHSLDIVEIATENYSKEGVVELIVKEINSFMQSGPKHEWKKYPQIVY